MKASIRLAVTIVGSLAATAPALAQGTRLAVGPDAGGYLCPDGRQLYVKSCYDNSPYANCGVVLMHLPPQRGYQQERTQTRAELTPSVAACKVYPVEFRNDGTVGLVAPKSVPPTQTAKAPNATPAPKKSTAAAPRSITVTDGMAIGRNGVRSSLVRVLSTEAKRIFYVDEASRSATAQTDVVTIWYLAVFADGTQPVAGAAAIWTEYAVNCKQRSYELIGYIALDRQATVLKAEHGGERGTVTKDSVSEYAADIACKPAQPFKGPRFASASAAIADAFAGAAPKVAAKPTAPSAKVNAAAEARLAFLEGERLWDEVGGDRAAVQQRKTAALAAFAKATKLDPTLRVAWLRQGEIYAENIDSLDAIPFYEKGMELDPKDVETAEAICEQYLFAGSSAAKGVAACERLLKLNPFDPTFAHSAVARLRQETGDNAKALVSALEWARLAPAESYAWTTLANIYVALARNTDALAAAQKAVKLEPKDWSVLALRGDVYRHLGKFTESIADYKAAIAIWPEGPELHRGLADSLRAAGRKAEADTEQRIAIDRALSEGRNALKKPADGSPISLGSILAANHFLEMLEKWDKSAAAKLAADIKAAQQ